MIVVDSSVWIANLRNILSEPVLRLHSAVHDAHEQILVGDLVMLEVLQGARDERHASRIEDALRRFAVVPMLDPGTAVRAATHYRTLRRRGITVRKTIDMIIGTFCIEGGHRLLHDDGDFTPMKEHLGLQIA